MSDEIQEQPPKHYGIRERVKWFMDRDATCIQDAEVFKSRWGEYPSQMSKRRFKKKIAAGEA